MAAKTKKAPAKKTATRKKPTSPRKPKGPATVVGSHPYEPGQKVGFWNAHDIGAEHSQGVRPFPKALETATVKKDGTLEVRGLPNGAYAAAAEVGDAYRYVFFSVK